MTTEDIIRMARKAGLINDCDGVYFRDQDSFEHFANLVAAAEREECAKVCESVISPFGLANTVSEKLAAAIRARGCKTSEGGNNENT